MEYVFGRHADTVYLNFLVWFELIAVAPNYASFLAQELDPAQMSLVHTASRKSADTGFLVMLCMLWLPRSQAVRNVLVLPKMVTLLVETGRQVPVAPICLASLTRHLLQSLCACCICRQTSR